MMLPPCAEIARGLALNHVNALLVLAGWNRQHCHTSSARHVPPWTTMIARRSLKHNQRLILTRFAGNRKFRT
jgi:hypothetical protein